MGIGKETFGVTEPSSFTAHVILAPNLDRLMYVNKCLQTGTVMVKSIDNQVESYVQIDKGSIHYIRFPSESELVGSAVICVKDPIYRSSKIVAVLQDEDDEQTIFEENQFRISKKSENNSVDIDAKGNSGELSIIVQTDNDKIENNFIFLSKNKKAKVNWIVQGDYVLSVDNSVTINSQKSFIVNIVDSNDKNNKVATIDYTYKKGFTLQDEFENKITTSDSNITLQTKNGEIMSLDKSGLSIKTSKEDLNDILSDFIDAIVQAVITTPNGPGSIAPPTILQLNELKARLINLFKQ